MTALTGEERALLAQLEVEALAAEGGGTLGARLREAQAIRDNAYTILVKLSAPITDTDDRPTPAQVDGYQKAAAVYDAACRRVAELEEDSDTSLMGRFRQPEVQRRVGKMRKELLAEYGEGGPQYRALCVRLASVAGLLDLMEEAGEMLSGRYDTYTKLVVSLVGQLQKYTESQKAEVMTVQIETACAVVLRLVARFVTPEVMKQILGEVHVLVDGPGLIEGAKAA